MGSLREWLGFVRFSGGHQGPVAAVENNDFWLVKWEVVGFSVFQYDYGEPGGPALNQSAWQWGLGNQRIYLVGSQKTFVLW